MCLSDCQQTVVVLLYFVVFHPIFVPQREIPQHRNFPTPELDKIDLVEKETFLATYSQSKEGGDAPPTEEHKLQLARLVRFLAKLDDCGASFYHMSRARGVLTCFF